MSKAIKNFFLGKTSKPDLKVANRWRFNSIHSDKRFSSLSGIYQQLIDGDRSLSDDEIIQQYNNFSKNIQTNTFAAAELELVSISTLCYFRPQLTDILIRASLLSIVYSLGDSIGFNDVINFVQYQVIATDAEPYGGWPTNEGLIWLSTILPTSRDTIEPILIDVIAKNREQLDSL